MTDSVLNFRLCNDKSYVGEYAFQEMFDPDADFDDNAMALGYESAVPILIRANHGPMIFANNTFSENIGTMGGAIQILSPNFESRN